MTRQIMAASHVVFHYFDPANTVNDMLQFAVLGSEDVKKLKHIVSFIPEILG